MIRFSFTRSQITARLEFDDPACKVDDEESLQAYGGLRYFAAFNPEELPPHLLKANPKEPLCIIASGFEEERVALNEFNGKLCTIHSYDESTDSLTVKLMGDEEKELVLTRIHVKIAGMGNVLGSGNQGGSRTTQHGWTRVQFPIRYPSEDEIQSERSKIRKLVEDDTSSLSVRALPSLSRIPILKGPPLLALLRLRRRMQPQTRMGTAKALLNLMRKQRIPMKF